MSFAKKRRARKHAFTLLEVLIALLILGLVAGAICAVVRGTLTGAATVEEAQNREEQIDGLIELCRKSFFSLPADATIEGRVRQENGKALPELIFRHAAQLWSWDRVRSLDTVTVLGLRPQQDGFFSLALLRVRKPDLNQDPVEGTHAQDWLVLVPNLRSVSWRFFNGSAGVWNDTQSVDAPRPSGIELEFTLAEDPVPIRVAFWVPALPPATLSTSSGTPVPITAP